jgi:hypothetical protein
MKRRIAFVLWTVCLMASVAARADFAGYCAGKANPAVCNIAGGYDACPGCGEPGLLNVNLGAMQINPAGTQSVMVSGGGGASSGTTDAQRAYQSCIKAGGTPESCRMAAHAKPVQLPTATGSGPQAVDPAIQRAWQAKVAPGSARYPDFASVVSRSQAHFSTFMYQCMTQSTHSADIAYYLGKNKGEVARIAGMGLFDTAIAIAEIETKVAQSK